MAIRVRERNTSRRYSLGQRASKERLFWIDGTDDADLAMQAMLAEAPNLLSNVDGPVLVKNDASVDPVGDDDLWYGTVAYGFAKRPKTGDVKYNFRMGLQSKHITHSLSTAGKYPAATAPDFKNAINVNGDRIDGAEILVPQANFDITWYMPLGHFNEAFLRKLFEFVGTKNDDQFYGAQINELLLLGVEGGIRDEEDVELRFSFAFSPNKANFQVGDIAVTQKGGWDYLWVFYRKKDIVAPVTMTVDVPKYVYVEEVYEPKQFAELGFGTTLTLN